MQDVDRAGPVRRITVRWSGTEWSTVAETRVDGLTLPASDALLPGKGQAMHGFWYELTDRQGRAIYRQLLEHPLTAHEPLGEGRSSFRESRSGGAAEFEILVPDAPSGVEVRFISDERRTSEGRLERLEGAEVVGVVPLHGSGAPADERLRTAAAARRAE